MHNTSNNSKPQDISPELAMGLSEIDQVAIGILGELLQQAVAAAGASVHQVLDVAASFLSVESHDALRNFHDLYFSGANQNTADANNDDVSRIFDQASTIMAQGGDVERNLKNITVDAGTEKSRLALSGLQKKLESVIAMETSFREKVGPILSGMQFEDAVRQRTEHIVQGWTKVLSDLGSSPLSFEPSCATMLALVSSADERSAFYQLVLRETAPVQEEERSVWLDFAA